MGNNIRSNVQANYVNGFTLVELLVTMGIIAILSMVAIPNFTKYKNLSDLNNLAKLIQSEIYKTRNLSLAASNEKNPLTNMYGFDILVNEDNTFTLEIKEVEYINNTNINTLKTVTNNILPKNIKISCSTSVGCMDIYYSIDKYGRIEFIQSSDKIDDVNYSIIITSDKVKNMSKQIIVNRVTGEVKINTLSNE